MYGKGLRFEISKNSYGLSPVCQLYLRNNYAFFRNKRNCGFLNLLEIRKKGYDTLVCAYIVKAVKIMGLMPQLERCAVCGCSIDSPATLSVGDGGIVCKKCTENTENKGNDTLIYKVSFDIVEVLKYFAKKPISDFKNLVLEEDMQHKVMAIIKSYISYHLDVGTLKSESLMVKNSGR